MGAKVLQAQETFLRKAPNGYIIFLGSEYPKNGMSYQLERKKKNGRYTVVAEIKSPLTLVELKSNIARFEQQLGKTSNHSDTLLNIVWENLVQDVMDYSSLDITFQLATGLAYFDTGMEDDGDFTYRIKQKGSLKSDKAIVLSTKKNIVTIDQEQPRFHSMSVNKNLVRIKWYFLINSDISAFDVYRAEENGRSYDKIEVEKALISENDTLFMQIKDTTVSPFTNYIYYTQIRDYCYYPTILSEKIRATSGMANEIPLVNLTGTPNPEARSVNLEWKIEYPDVVKYVEIYKSTLFDGPYVKIAELPSSKTRYVDQLHMAGTVFYYYAVASTSFGKSFETGKEIVIFEGVDKPRVPEGIEIIGEDGQVKISWRGGESLVRGYYVYRSTSPEGEMKQISSLIPRSKELLSYTDELPEINGNTDYFYSIRAESDGFIKSDFSDTVSYRAIDTKVPMPNYINVRVDGNKRFITWQGMKMEYDNLAKYLVYRNSGDGLVLIGETSSVENYYTDKEPIITDTVQYAVRAVSHQNFQSKATYSKELGLKSNLPEPPGDITTFVSGKSVIIKWGYIIGDNIKSIRIYRSDEQGNTTIAGEVESNKTFYKDNSVKEGGLYQYTITSINNLDVESRHSQEVILRK